MVAGAWPGVVVPFAEGAETDVETLYYREYIVSEECGKGNDVKREQGGKLTREQDPVNSPPCSLFTYLLKT